MRLFLLFMSLLCAAFLLVDAATVLKFGVEFGMTTWKAQSLPHSPWCTRDCLFQCRSRDSLEVNIGFHVLFAMMSVVGSDCRGDGWGGVVSDSEARILHREDFIVPRDPLGTKYEAACVRLRFHIDGNGVATGIRIDRSSKNRVIDLAAMKTLGKFTFSAPTRASEEEFALVFEYAPQANPEVRSVRYPAG